MKEQIYLAVFQGGTLWLNGVKKRKSPPGAIEAMGGRERCWVRQKEDGSWEFFGDDPLGHREPAGGDMVE